MRSRLRKAILAAVTVAGTLGFQPMTGTATANPVVGYIQIKYNAATMPNGPTVVLSGVLRTPAWSCSQTIWANDPTAPFTVTCTAVPPAGGGPKPVWRCDVLHADATTYSALAKLRTSMYCDGSLVARTRTVQGAGGRDFKWGASGTTANTTVVCVTDNGDDTLPKAAVPDFMAFCGDPPLLDKLPI